MSLALTYAEGLLFLPFVAPICLWVIYSDLSTMKITNMSNLALLVIFVGLGLFVLPIEAYGWRLAQFAIVLVIGIVANAMGVMGAGDSKFLAAAAPFVAPGDGIDILLMLGGVTIVAVIAHRIVKNTSLRQMAPDWVSWSRPGKFPMGLALGSTLILYLALGVVQGT
ncbi:A24 family peptidase [Roseovarius sp. 2305UL8-3]|uniref:A24 family peptidase n=1 Tax=Roseovarius conchicola TaxID=3121636 RepID=UPI003527990A